MLIFKRNQIVITALIIVIMCAGYLNFKYNKAKLSSTNTPIGSPYLVNGTGSQQDPAPVAKVNGDYFVVTRAEKERAREDQKELYQDIVNNKNATQEGKDKAQTELMNIAKNVQKEVVIEGVLKGKGFSDVLAFINENKIDIVIKDNTNLLPSQQAMILDVVTRETGFTAENIKINPQKPAQTGATPPNQDATKKP